MNRVLILSLGKLTDDADGDFALPVRIRSESGTVIDRGILSTRRPKAFQLSDEKHASNTSSDHSTLSWVFVDIVVRHGAAITRRIPVIGHATHHTIELVPEDIPGWLAWAAADVNLMPRERISFSDTPAYHVTGKLWARRFGKWRPVELGIGADHTNQYAKQFELTTSEPSLLQISGPELPSRFISLPQGRVKVLLAAAARQGVNGDALNIVVSRLPAGPRNTVLSLLSITDAEQAGVAEELGEGFDWQGVGEDPLSGCALGCAAMRLRAFDRFTLADARSLFDLARGSSDAAIVFASRAIAEDNPDFAQVMRLLSVGLEGAVPVLAQSLAAANMVLDCLRRRAAQIDQRSLAALADKARAYSSAKAGATLFMSFYGSAPDVPGMQQAAQRPDQETVSGLGKAFTAVLSSFKPVASTTLVCAERKISQAHRAPVGAT
jgi:hypothetical protein